MQIEITVRCHLIPIRMAIIINQQTGAEEGVEKRELFALLVGMQIGAATVESSECGDTSKN